MGGGDDEWSKLQHGALDLVHDGGVPKVNKFAINKARDEERKRDARLEEEKEAAGFKKTKKEQKGKEADPFRIPKKWMLR